MNAQTQLPNTLPYTTVVKTCTLSLQLQTVVHTHTSTDLWFKTPMRTLKVEAAAWLKGASHVRDQCTGGDEHVPNEVHGLLFCQDHQVGVCEPRKIFSFCLHLLLRTSQQLAPTCCNRSTADLFTISLLSRTLHLFPLFLNL